MTETASARKLGELLVDLGVFTEEEIRETVQIAVQIGLPLGRALILSNKLREEQLRIVLQIQSLLKDHVLDMPTASNVLKAVRFEGLTLSAALQKCGVAHKPGPDDKMQRSKLANLLLDAGLVSEEDIEEAVKIGYETGTPVGRMLVVSGRINHSVLARALEIQVMLRENKMSHSEAIQLLKAESLRVLPVEQSAEQRGLSQQESKRVRLGELLMLSGVLTEGDMLNVLEMGLTSPKPLGDILMEMGLVSRAVLDMALSLQEMISKDMIDIRSAASSLQEMASTGKAVDPKNKPFSEDDEPVRLGDLLKMTGLVDNEDIQQAIELSSKYPAMIGKMLVVAGAIDEGTLLAALRSQFLLRNKAIAVDDSVQAPVSYTHLTLPTNREV